jgi:AAHS family 4-hydroxybenzoate transporter-like MFS transporter
MTDAHQTRGAARAAAKVDSTLVVLLTFIIVMIDGYDTIMPSFIAPLVAKDFALTIQGITRLFFFGYLGAVVGAVGAGQFADRIGRRSVLVLSLVVSAVGTLLCAFAPSFATLLDCRFVAGLGLGGAIPSLISLTAEHAPADRRHARVTLMYIGYPVGAVVGGFVTSLLLGIGWPVIFVGSGIVTLAMVPLAFAIPETLASTHGAATGSAAGPRSLPQRLAAPFGDGRFGAAAMLCLGLFCMLLMTYLLVWAPTMAVRSGLPPKVAALTGVVLNLGGVVGALALRPVVNRRGPFAPVAIMVGVGAIAILLLGQSFGSVPLLMAALFCVGVTALGGQLVCPAMTVALFPVPVRGAGAGWALAMGRVGSIVGPIVGGVLLAAGLSLGWLFAFVAIAAAIAAIAFAVADRIRPAA